MHEDTAKPNALSGIFTIKGTKSVQLRNFYAHWLKK